MGCVFDDEDRMIRCLVTISYADREEDEWEHTQKIITAENDEKFGTFIVMILNQYRFVTVSCQKLDLSFDERVSRI